MLKLKIKKLYTDVLAYMLICLPAQFGISQQTAWAVTVSIKCLSINLIMMDDPLDLPIKLVY
jgi:hypothetical protein